MKLSSRQKKWGKLLGVLFALGLIFGGILYYVVVKKFEQIIQYTVTKESDGLYFFEAENVKLNLLKKSIQVKNAIVFCTDTSLVQTHHELRTPKIYLGINSWIDLLFNKKLIIDSLHIESPNLSSNDHLKDEQVKKGIAFHASTIFDMLQKLAGDLEIHSLNIQNGTYSYTNNKNNIPFTCNHIYLLIKNFSKKEGKATRLFSSDDLDISLYNQHWILPGGEHDIRFKRVHFSGKKQFFELDTCTFHKASEEGKSEITLSADQFFFNSKRLTAIHEKEELLIDTLICFRPVLSLIPADKKNIIPDSIGSVSQFIKGIFNNINFKYIDIREGELSITHNNSLDTVHTTKTNLKVYNLTINPIIEPHITTDSIKLDLNKILFFTKDSLNQMSIDEFKLYNNDIIFNNAVYGPTPRNHSGKAITFTTASLTLKNINLEALVKKRIKATRADLYNPSITMNFQRKESRGKDNQKKTAQFFEILHEVSELIEVGDFNILHGNLHYLLEGDSPVKMEMTNMNAHILLTDFLESDSLIDIKRSIPTVSVENISVQTTGAKLMINGYNIDGDYRRNLANNFLLTLANGTSIKGKHLNWELLAWDQYVYHRIIQVENLSVKELTVLSASSKEPATKNVKIKLPRFEIHRFEMDHLNFTRTNFNHHIQFTAAAATMDNITTKNNFLEWQNARATLHDLVFNNKNSTAAVGKITFTNLETTFNETSLALNHNTSKIIATIPLLKIDAAINSTDFSILHLASLVATHPQLNIYNNNILARTGIPAAIKIPLRLIADKCILNDATIRDTSIKEQDTTIISSRATVNIMDLQTNKRENSILSFAHATIDLSDIQFKNSHLSVDVPKSNSLFSNGTLRKNNQDQLIFNTGIMANWLGAAINVQKRGDVSLQAIDIKGTFKSDSFSIEPKTKLRWQQLVTQTQIQDAKLYYKNKTIAAIAGSIEWDPLIKTFYARKYSVLPNLGEAETFSKAEWQADYLTVEGEAASISGLQFDQLQKEAALHIRTIAIENTTLEATRDRNIPFRHNIEKLMPGALLQSFKKRIQVDSVFVKNSTISVHEIAEKTNKKTTIPITQLNGVITGLNNIKKDSLTINAKAFIFNNAVTNFYYREANKDSLSFFNVKVNVAPLQLTNLNDATIPMANIRIKKGSADTLYAIWAGNKHAAAGNMNFYYHQLKIQLLDKNDIEKNRFILSVVSNLSSLVFRKKNTKPALIYYIRDKEKFVFNYWVKTIASGILTSAGIRKDKHYIKQYNAVKEKYGLPDLKQ